MNAWHSKDEFKARVFQWAEQLDIKVHALAVRPMRNKWASCSTAGNLNFNDELLALTERSLTMSSFTSCYISLFQITGSFGKA
jgi:predicted metal-dependent hydrolase